MYTFKTKTGILRVDTIIAGISSEAEDFPATDLVLYQQEGSNREVVLGCYKDHNRAIEATLIMGYNPKALAVALRRAMTLASDLPDSDIAALNLLLQESGVQVHKESYLHEIQESYVIGKIYTACPSGA